MPYKKLFFLLYFFSLTNLAHSQLGTQDEELTLVMQHYAKAVEKYDTAAIEKLFDDRMIVTSTNGKYRNKQQEIADLLYQPSNTTLDFFVAEELKIIAEDQTGVVKGILRWQFKGQPATSRTFTFALIKKGKDWKILAQHIGRTS